ncbi:unnamed protein product [Ambrosiozyma monospora]|uniref:Unnamed protein product n=1 Tax=Ambrosiozyma monospora TaxID=43982 RepID=A0A9W6Z6C7_AMBMO|nr:unnamed protein product [Ambrosiozyma monospora]
MHIILLRHCTRIDKFAKKKSADGNVTPEPCELDSSSWIANFDPPVAPELASKEVANAFKKISSNLSDQKHSKKTKLIIHSSPYNRCIQTTELLLDQLKSSKFLEHSTLQKSTKLRIDHALSEWLNENFNLHYLPPNDDGYSMISNVNTYFSTSPKEDADILTRETRNTLRSVRDHSWMHNKLGHCGDYETSRFLRTSIQPLSSCLTVLSFRHCFN